MFCKIKNVKRHQKKNMKHDILNKLYDIYREYVNSEPNPDSQLCVIWPLDDPPNILETTPQLESIEEILDINIYENDAVELFDMSLVEASNYIENLINKQQSKKHNQTIKRTQKDAPLMATLCESKELH